MTPQHVRTSISRSIEQVEQLVETMYEQRVGVFKLLQLLTVKYEKSSALLKIKDDLDVLDLQIKEKQDHINTVMNKLGHSIADVDIMIQQTSSLMTEGQELSNQASNVNNELHKVVFTNNDFIKKGLVTKNRIFCC